MRSILEQIFMDNPGIDSMEDVGISMGEPLPGRAGGMRGAAPDLGLRGFSPAPEAIPASPRPAATRRPSVNAAPQGAGMAGVRSDYPRFQSPLGGPTAATAQSSPFVVDQAPQQRAVNVQADPAFLEFMRWLEGAMAGAGVPDNREYRTYQTQEEMTNQRQPSAPPEAGLSNPAPPSTGKRPRRRKRARERGRVRIPPVEASAAAEPAIPAGLDTMHIGPDGQPRPQYEGSQLPTDVPGGMYIDYGQQPRSVPQRGERRRGSLRRNS